MDKIFVFVTGSIIGSFLNVCIWRLPKRKSIVIPRSHCPVCEKIIPWYDNIPILSFLLLRGRCRSCKTRIPFRYLLVELLTALSILSLYIVFALTAKFFAYSILISELIIATFVDFEIQEIPDQVTLLGIVLGFGLALAFPSIFGTDSRWRSFYSSFLGAAAGGASIYLVGFIWERIRKKEAMGGGDVKLLAMIGSFIGWRLTILTFFIAPFFGSIPGIILMMKDRRQTIPYGPYLSLAALVSILWGERMLRLLFYGL